MYKILIVEDDSIIAGTLKNHLCQWGFEVRCIEDFKNVLEETADFTPHLILLDIILPYEYRHGDEYGRRRLYRKAL